MTYLVTAPEALATAAADVSGIGAKLTAASAAVAGSTTKIAAAAADEVSASIAELFGGHGVAFQAASAQTATFSENFVQNLASSAGLYQVAEAVNASPLGTFAQDVFGAVNARLFGTENKPAPAADAASDKATTSASNGNAANTTDSGEGRSDDWRLYLRQHDEHHLRQHDE